MVEVQLHFPAGFTPPECAPGCLISLPKGGTCGEASLDPSQEGYPYGLLQGASMPREISDDGLYPLTLYVSARIPSSHHAILTPSFAAKRKVSAKCSFLCAAGDLPALLRVVCVFTPVAAQNRGTMESKCCAQFSYAANYPPLGEPPIMTACINYASDPCDSAALTHLGDIIFDATKPTLSIRKISEKFGDPRAATTSKLRQTSAPLLALMLFNFSKSGGLSAASQARYAAACASLENP